MSSSGRRPMAMSFEFAVKYLLRSILLVGFLGVCTILSVLNDCLDKKRRNIILDTILPWRYWGARPLVYNLHDICSAEGYRLEEWVVNTEDGYILTLHRLALCASPSETRDRGKPILLTHALLNSSHAYLLNQSDSLGFVLAANGYDVWLLNNRGNTFSRRHTKHIVNSEEFWDFGVDELGMDVRDSVNFILESTGQRSLAYVGHSQGCTQGFISVLDYPELASKIDVIICLAPGCFVKKMPSKPLLMLASLTVKFPGLFWFLFGKYDFMRINEFIRDRFPRNWYSLLAFSFYNFLLDWGDEHWDKSRKPLYFAFTPAGTSMRNVAQWLQQSATGRMAKFDYGNAAKNQAVYGQPIPPEYDLTKMPVPTAVIYGGRDSLLDHARLAATLPRCVLALCLPHHDHNESLIARDVPEVLFPHLLSLLNKHAPSKRA